MAIPDAPLDVVPTPPFLASLVPFAAYEPPPIYLGAQRGRFYVTVPDPSLPAEAVGAAAPGARPPRHSGDGGARGVSRPPPPARDRRRGCRREVRRHLWTPIMVEGWALYCEQLAGRGGLLPDAGAAAVPAGEPALARHPGRARRRPPHAGHDAGRGGGLHGGAPADRAAERGGRGAPLLRVAHLPALLRGRSPRAAAAPRGLRRPPARTSIRAGFTTTLLGYGGLPVSLARWGMDIGRITASERSAREDHRPDVSRQRRRELEGVRSGRAPGGPHPPPPGAPRLGARRPRRRQAPHRRPLPPQARARLQPDGDVRRQRLRRHPRHRPAGPARAPLHRQRPGRALPEPGQGAHQEAARLRGHPVSRATPCSPARPRSRPAATSACRCS